MTCDGKAQTTTRAADDEIIPPTRIENVRVRDGVNIAVAVYLPKDAGRYPTLFAASPYRQ